jgi:hypothetical protein
MRPLVGVTSPVGFQSPSVSRAMVSTRWILAAELKQRPEAVFGKGSSWAVHQPGTIAQATNLKRWSGITTSRRVGSGPTRRRYGVPRMRCAIRPNVINGIQTVQLLFNVR